MTTPTRPFWTAKRLPEPLASMTTGERADWLRARGWRSMGGSRGSWLAPDPTDPGFYSMAAALRCAVADRAERDNR